MELRLCEVVDGEGILYAEFKGTSETVVVQHLTVADSIDEQILNALQAKDRTQTALIEAVKADLKGSI